MIFIIFIIYNVYTIIILSYNLFIFILLVIARTVITNKGMRPSSIHTGVYTLTHLTMQCPLRQIIFHGHSGGA